MADSPRRTAHTLVLVIDEYGPPPTPEGRAIAALHMRLVTLGLITSSAGRPDTIRWELLAGEEWLALEEVLALVWPPEAVPPDVAAEAAAVALATAGGSWSVDQFGSDPSPEAFVRRWFAHRPCR